MKFKVISVGKGGNLLLSSDKKTAIQNKIPIFLDGRKVAEVFDTIGKVESPLYLAKPAGNGKELVGKDLENKNI